MLKVRALFHLLAIWPKLDTNLTPLNTSNWLPLSAADNEVIIEKDVQFPFIVGILE